MKLNILIISTSFLCSFYSWADIPLNIKTDAQKYIKALNENNISNLNGKELSIVKDNIADIIMHKFQEEIPVQTKDGFRKELLQFIDNNSASLLNLTPVIDLIKAFNGELSGNIVRIKYKGIDVPLNVKFDLNNKKITVKLEGPSNTAGQNDCILLSINLKQSNAFLHYLSTQAACPIPSVNRNSAFLVGLVDDVAKTMGAKKVELEDGSGMLCTKNQKSINFRVLRIFQHKKGLYENFGYSPLMDYSVKIRQEITFANDIKISHVVALIATAEFKERFPKEQQDALDIFKSTYPIFQAEKDNSDSLSDYLAWLWVYNCAFYVDVYKLLFKTKLFWPDNPYMKLIGPRYLKWFTPL